MKKFKRIITSILLGALTLSVFAFIGCKTSEEQANNDSDVDIAVLTSYESSTQDGQKCLAQEVVATVSGVSSITQPIDLQWSLHIPPVIGSIGGPIENPIWGDKKSDYIILESTPYDETTQTSTCILKLIKAIPDGGVIDLNVNCNNNKISKSIKVKYNPKHYKLGVTIPEDISIYEDPEVLDHTDEPFVYELISGNTYVFNFVSLGFFDDFASGYNGGEVFMYTYGNMKFCHINDCDNTYKEQNQEYFNLDKFCKLSSSENSNFSEYIIYNYDVNTGNLFIRAGLPYNELQIVENIEPYGSSYYRVHSNGDDYDPFVTLYFRDYNNSDNDIKMFSFRVVSAE